MTRNLRNFQENLGNHRINVKDFLKLSKSEGQSGTTFRISWPRNIKLLLLSAQTSPECPSSQQV